jgi:hypothetical protein
MRAFYNEVIPVQIDISDNNDGSNVCRQMNDGDSVVDFDDLHVD